MWISLNLFFYNVCLIIATKLKRFTMAHSCINRHTSMYDVHMPEAESLQQGMTLSLEVWLWFVSNSIDWGHLKSEVAFTVPEEKCAFYFIFGEDHVD